MYDKQGLNFSYNSIPDPVYIGGTIQYDLKHLMKLHELSAVVIEVISVQYKNKSFVSMTDMGY